MLDELQKWVCRTVVPSLAASLEPSAQRQNVARLSIFCRYCFGRCLSKLTELCSLSYSRGNYARFFNWYSLHARLNSHCQAWCYKKKEVQKDYSMQEICLERTYR